jgi:hypothetical protein
MSYVNLASVEHNNGVPLLRTTHAEKTDAGASAVSWAAIFAGAAAAAALSLILLILGSGLGLQAVSPWSPTHNGNALGISAILWLTLTQLIASGMGGYLAGRLRSRWLETHVDEVYFRDTAHGFLAWALATLVTAALLTSMIGSIIGGGMQAGALAAGAAVSGNGGGPTAYFTDALLRSDPAKPVAAAVVPDPVPAEVGRIYANSLRGGPLPDDDVRYLGGVVAMRSGLSQEAAEARVRDNYSRLQARLRDAATAATALADEARKVSTYTALWLFISLLGGAFLASLAATFGGRRRDS